MGKEEKKEKKASKKHSSKEDKPFFPSSSSSSATIKKSKRTLEENQKLTSDSYFIKMDHFRVWLKQYKLKSFEDLTTEKAMKYFSKFILAYNEGSLEDFYYLETLPLDIKASSTKTAHKSCTFLSTVLKRIQ